MSVKMADTVSRSQKQPKPGSVNHAILRSAIGAAEQRPPLA